MRMRWTRTRQMRKKRMKRVQAGAPGSAPTMMLMRSDFSHAFLSGHAGLVLGSSLLRQAGVPKLKSEMGMLND